MYTSYCLKRGSRPYYHTEGTDNLAHCQPFLRDWPNTQALGNIAEALHIVNHLDLSEITARYQPEEQGVHDRAHRADPPPTSRRIRRRSQAIYHNTPSHVTLEECGPSY